MTLKNEPTADPPDEKARQNHSSQSARSRGDAVRWFFSIALLAAIYFASAKFGLSLAFVAEQVSSVWPPTGIALAAILLFGFRLWPGIALGAFIANVTANEPFFTAAGIAAGNTLEAVVAAWLLKRVAKFENGLQRISDVIALILLAAGFSTMISATIGVASLCFGEVFLPSLERPIEWSDFGWLWWTWWLGDAIGTLVVTPLLLTWSMPSDLLSRRRIVEAAAMIVGLFATSWVVFLGGTSLDLSGASLAYAVFPFVIWAALRFGQPGTTAVTFVAAVAAILASVNGLGPFGDGPVHDRLLLLQVFMGIVAVTALLLGAAIAGRRRIEADLRDREEVLRAAVEELQTLVSMLPVGIFISKDPECRSITMNPAGAAMLKLPPEADPSKTGPAAENLPFRIMKNGVEIPSDELPMQWAARTGTPVIGEEVDIVRDGEANITLYEYASPLFDSAGKVRGCLGVFIDITGRKQAEQALRDADRRKDEFLATLAHELRNPLAPIRTGIDYLQLLDMDDPELRNVLGMLDRQVLQITRLVDDLMDVSRVTRGKVCLNKQLVALDDVVNQAIEMNRPLCDLHGHELSVSLPSPTAYIEADSTRLAQVFANLLNNAAKYSQRGSRISLSAAHENDEVVVRVRDTGYGIDRETIRHIFELFVQGNHSLTRSEGGLGIGLTLVHRLVEMHGGTVQAHSDGIGHGSEFMVRLPVALAHPQDAPLQLLDKDLITMEPNRQILVVDDNVDAARTMELLLRTSGCCVTVVHSGTAALEKIADKPLEVVLLDIGLPDIDGYEVARRIRNLPHGRDIVLVAVTGWGQPEDRKRATEAGFDHHLTKPVEHALLKSLLTQRNPIDQSIAGNL
jgi:signal transduction histidine kinase/integral membrane sensor domain MASE1/ActR/RegA family two-component response regulator